MHGADDAYALRNGNRSYLPLPRVSILNLYYPPLNSLKSTTVGQFIVEIVVTFLLGVLIEGLNYYRYNYQVTAYANAAKQSSEG